MQIETSEFFLSDLDSMKLENSIICLRDEIIKKKIIKSQRFYGFKK